MQSGGAVAACPRRYPCRLFSAASALLLGVTAEISSLHARLLPASLIAAIFTLSPAGNMPIWEPLLIYAFGTLWYGVFNWFWFWLWREQPLRESLSLLYRELADYCEAKYSLLTQHTDPSTALPPLLTRQQKVVDLITQCYQQMHMLAANQRNDHKRLLRAFQMGLDLQEHISVSLHQPEEVQKLVERSHAEAVIRWNAQTVAARLRVLADDMLYHRFPKRFQMDKQIEALEKIARQHPDNPVGHFCASALQPHRPGAAYPAPAVCPGPDGRQRASFTAISRAKELPVAKISRAAQCRPHQRDAERRQPDGQRPALA